MVFLPKTPNPSLILRKTPTEEYSTKYLMNIPQNCQGHLRNKESERNFYSCDD